MNTAFIMGLAIGGGLASVALVIAGGLIPYAFALFMACCLLVIIIGERP